MTAQALSGLKVVEFGEFISAAYCAKMMADLGALFARESTGRGQQVDISEMNVHPEITDFRMKRSAVSHQRSA